MGNIVNIDKIVNININFTNNPTPLVNFNKHALISSYTTTSPLGTDRLREYDSLQSVETDFASTTNEYKYAAVYFGQNITPNSLIIVMCNRTDNSGTPTEKFEDAINDALTQSNFYYVSFINPYIDFISDDEAIATLTALSSTSLMLVVQTGSPDIIDPANTQDIATKIIASNTTKTIVIYDENQDMSNRLDAAYISQLVSKNISEIKTSLLTFEGVNPTNTDQNIQEEIINNKKVSFYSLFNGDNIRLFRKGFITSSVNLTVLERIVADYIKNSLQTALLDMLTNKRIPINTLGEHLTRTKISAILNANVSNGIINNDYKINIAPKTQDDIDNRRLGLITITITIAGEVQAINITLNVGE